MVSSLHSRQHVLSSMLVNKPIVSTHLRLWTGSRPKQETDSQRMRRRCEQPCFRCGFIFFFSVCGCVCLSCRFVLFKRYLFVCVGRAEKPPAFRIQNKISLPLITQLHLPCDILLTRKPKGIGKMLRVLVVAVVFLLLVAFQLSILAFCPCVRFFGNGCRMDFWLTVLSDGLSELWAFWNGRHERVRRKKYTYFVLKPFQNFVSWKKLDGIFNGLLKESLFFERCQLVLLLGKRNNMEKCDKWEY